MNISAKSAISFLTRSKNSFESSPSKIITFAILGIWLAMVIFTTTRHEFWRDEVRALSLARAAIFPTDLYELIKYDGHPVLWYLLLYIGKTIIDIPLILPITSIAIAITAVTIFMISAPFPFWFRCLFIFCGLPFYEYSVMARNYGISMLLIFIAAALYRSRDKHPLWLAFVLALLANTNVHSAILVCLIAAIWVGDMIVADRTTTSDPKDTSFILAMVIICAGILLCLVFTLPQENTILTSVRKIDIHDLIESFFAAGLHPEETFLAIVPKGVPPLIAGLLLYLAILGLLRPTFVLAALGAQLSFGIFFREIYGGGYRHQGLFLIFLLFLYWIFMESRETKNLSRAKHILFKAGFFVAMLVLILGNIAEASRIIPEDINGERSSSKAFGQFLNTSENYLDAIIVPEPDYLLESLPYYAQNRIYLPREQRFGTTVSWTTEANVDLSLGELISTAYDLKTRYNQPVLIAVGHTDFELDESGKIEYSYNKIFFWNEKELADFYGSTFLVANFNNAYSDENYRVYEIK